MSEDDAVQRLLRARGCPDEVVHGGLEGLADKWDAIVSSVERGYSFGLDDLLNDMDLRDVLAAALAVAAGGDDALRARVEVADNRLRAASVPSPCLWGEDVEADDGLDPGREWWYYLRPSILHDELAGELAAWGLLNDEEESA